ncbi:hypothetical protein NQZ68_005767 [Dissostichus eleginoides]|nr:hypothetical protein NQZ68_005767 [Dissostichus eleginoides]
MSPLTLQLSCDFRRSCYKPTYAVQILLADIKQEREEKTSIGRNTRTSGRLGISERADPVSERTESRLLDQLIREQGSRLRTSRLRAGPLRRINPSREIQTADK